MTTLTAAQRRRLSLAAHEAGHAVIGVIHGARLITAAITADGSTGRTSFTAQSFTTAGALTYRSHIACAGAVAEALFAHGPRPTIRQVDALLRGDDRAELEVVAMTTMHREPLPVAPVARLLTRCWNAVAELAADIYTGQAITHADVCRALRLDDDGGPQSVGLAVLRNTA